MTVVLYIGKNSSDYSCYKQFFDNDSYEYEIGLDYFGYFFTINIEDAQLNRLVSHIYEFIVVCHLKEYILK